MGLWANVRLCLSGLEGSPYAHLSAIRSTVEAIAMWPATQHWRAVLSVRTGCSMAQPEAHIHPGLLSGVLYLQAGSDEGTWLATASLQKRLQRFHGRCRHLLLRSSSGLRGGRGQNSDSRSSLAEVSQVLDSWKECHWPSLAEHPGQRVTFPQGDVLGGSTGGVGLQVQMKDKQLWGSRVCNTCRAYIEEIS